MLEWIKAHPYIAGGAVFFLGVLLVIGMGGTDTEAVETSGGEPDYSGAVAAANTLAQMQIQGQVASRMSDNDLAAKTAEIDGAYKLGAENFKYLSNKDVLAAKVAVRGLEADEFVSSLAASTAQAQVKGQVAIANAQFSRDVQISTITAGVANNKTAAEADVAKTVASYAFQQRVNEIQTNANLEVYKTHSATYNADKARELDYAKLALDRETMVATEYRLNTKNNLDFVAANFAALH